MEALTAITTQFASPDEEIRRQAVAALRHYPFEKTRDLVFAAMGDESWRVRKEAVNILLEAPPLDEVLVTVCELLRSHDNAGIRNSAVEVLERLGVRAIPVLLRYVHEEDHDVRKFVVDIMGNIGDRSCSSVLIGLLDDPDANVRSAAAENLGKIGDGAAAGALIRSLAREEIAFRHTVLEALGAMGAPVSIERLAPLAEEPLLKRGVFECLGSVGDIEAIPFLVAGIGEKARSSREAAVKALIKLRRRLPDVYHMQVVDRELARLKGTPVVDGLLASIRMAGPELKEAILELLAVIGDRRAIRALVQGCQDIRVTRYCLKALRNMGAEAVSALVDMFPVAEQEEKAIIASLCGELGSRGFEQILLEGMGSDHSYLRMVSVRSAGKIGLESSVSEAARLLDDDDLKVREAAVATLVRLAGIVGDQVRDIAQRLGVAGESEKRHMAVLLFSALADLDKLQLLMKDESPRVRSAAVTGLAGVKNPATAGTLAMALADEDVDVRVAAATGLGMIRGENSLDPLLVSLFDPDQSVRRAAVKSLGRVGGERAFAALLDFMSRSEGGELIVTLESLARIDKAAAIELVLNCLDNPDPEVVKTAIDILSQGDALWIDGSREKLLTHPHWGVRSCFVRAMARLLGADSIPLLRAALENETDDMVREQILDLLEGLR